MKYNQTEIFKRNPEFYHENSDYKTINKNIQCFRCQGFDLKVEFCNIIDKYVKCTGDHPSRTCTKQLDQPARCVNCDGKHCASYMVCPEVKNIKNGGG